MQINKIRPRNWEIYGFSHRTDKSMAGCVTLVEQVENDKIFDMGHGIKTPSAGNENDPMG